MSERGDSYFRRKTMKKLTAFFVSLYLVLLLSAPVAMAGDHHGGLLPPPPEGGGGNIVWPSKGDLLLYQLLSFVVSVERAIPLI